MSLSPNTQHTAFFTALLTALHLMVDGLCACSVLMLQGSLTGVGVAVLFIGYNVLAFMTQPFVGLWMDRHRTGPMILWAAALLLLSGGLLTTLYPCCSTTVSDLPQFMTISNLPQFTTGVTEMTLLVCIALLLGMGNSLFHVYGGKFVTERTVNDPRHLGFFVSSGALGLALGGAGHSLALMGTLAVTMLVAVVLFQRCVCVPCSEADEKPCDQSQGTTGAAPIPISPSPQILISPSPEVSVSTQPHTSVGSGLAVGTSSALLLFMLFLVFGRSFIGNMKPDSVGDIACYATVASVLAFVGKASGGFIARRVGVWTTLTTALIASAVCLLLSGSYWMFAALMVLCINITMPLTLHLANRSLPQRAGMAFGALAFMLIPGHALGLCLAGSIVVTHLLYTLVATIVIEALVLFALGERRWTVLAMSMVMNVLTNLPLNLAVRFVPVLQQPSFALQIILECVVAVVEFLLFYAVTRHRRTAVIYAVACNATSYLCGLLFELVLTLFN